MPSVTESGSRKGFFSLDLPQRFGPKTQQGPYDIWRHPGDKSLAIVVSTDRANGDEIEPGIGAIRARISAFASSAVKDITSGNKIASLHPNVLIVELLRGEHTARITFEGINRKIDPHARRLADDLGRIGQRMEELLRDVGYTIQEFHVRVGRGGDKKRKIGMGLLAPGTAVILNTKTGDPVRKTQEWEEMLFDLTGYVKTPLDSNPENIFELINRTIPLNSSSTS